jgi:hypothetical protein
MFCTINYQNITQDNDDLVIHIRQLTKVCATNGKDTYDHKLQCFPKFFRGRTVDWFAKYKMVHPVATWDVKWASESI